MDAEQLRELLHGVGDYADQRVDEKFDALVLPLFKRIAELEARALVVPKDGRDGRDGKNGDKGDKGIRGEQGQRGLTGDRGDAGDKGAQGERGIQGLQGEHGQRGEQGLVGDKGEPGKAGERGVDGKSITLAEVEPFLEAMRAKWELDFERRAFAFMQGIIDRAPKAKDGVDGKDGIGFDNLSVEQLDERNCVVRFTLGAIVKDFPIKLSALIDQGVWSESETEYLKGDGVSWGGSFFIAQKDAPEGEPGTSPDWRLAVKRGRNGNDTVKLASAPSAPVRIAR